MQQMYAHVKELARFQRISSITGIKLLFNTWLPDHSMNFGLRGKTTLIWPRSQLHAAKIWVNGILFMLIISHVLRKPSAVETLSCQCRTNFSRSIFSAYLTYIVFRIYNGTFLIHCYLDYKGIFLIHCYLDYKQWFTKLLYKNVENAFYSVELLDWFHHAAVQSPVKTFILFVRQCWWKFFGQPKCLA